MRKLSLIAFILILLVGLVFGQKEDPHRLNFDVIPTFQKIHLLLDADKADYTGKTEIQFKVDNPTNEIRLHALEMNLLSVELKKEAQTFPFTREEGYRGLQVLKVDHELGKGEYVLYITFSNDLDTKATSLYKVNYEANNYTFTQFEPDDARRAFPCFDEPSFKFPYQMVLTVPEYHKAYSNTPVEQKKKTQLGIEYTYKRSKPMPSYLLAIATGPFESIPVDGMSMPGRIIFPKGKEKLATLAAEMTPPIVKALEDYFGRDYPFAKLDQIAVPDFTPGAMENIGLITYKDQILLADKERSTFGSKRGMASTIAHEIAHMWFGNLVTMAWWDDLWLNESFASWMGDKVVDVAFPEFNMINRKVITGQRIMETDALLSTKSIYQPIYTEDNIFQKAATGITYSKGQAVLEMIESWIGEENFQKGMRLYMEKHEWKNTVYGDLWEALSEASGKTVKKAMEHFITRPGVPIVSLDFLPDNSIQLRQERYLNIGDKNPEDYTWQIPMALKYSDGDKIYSQKMLFDQKDTTVKLKTDKPLIWLHPNLDQMSYYRWQMDDEHILALFSKGMASLTERERMAGMLNMYALVNTGTLPVESYMDNLFFFSKDKSFDVLNILASQVNQIRRDFDLPELRNDFALYYRNTLKPVLSTLGYEKKSNEAENIASVRANLIYNLSVFGKDEATKAKAYEIKEKYLKDPASVDPSLRNTSIYVTAYYGDEKLFDEYRLKFENATIPRERQLFLNSLGNFHDEVVIRKALDYVLTGPIKPTEFFTIPFGITQWPEYNELVFTWFENNYDKIKEKMPQPFWAYLPYFYGGSTNLQDLERANKFFDKVDRQIPGTQGALTDMETRVKRRIKLRQSLGEEVRKYLKKYNQAIQ